MSRQLTCFFMGLMLCGCHTPADKPESGPKSQQQPGAKFDVNVPPNENVSVSKQQAVTGKTGTAELINIEGGSLANGTVVHYDKSRTNGSDREKGMASVVRGEVELAATVDEQYGLKVALVVTNTSNSALLFVFTSGQKGDLVIHDRSGRELWRWSADMMFTQAIVEKHFAVNESRRYAFYIPQKVLSQLTETSYTLTVSFAAKLPAIAKPAMADIHLPFSPP